MFTSMRSTPTRVNHLRVSDRSKESPMDWEGESAGSEPLPPWASSSKRTLDDVKDTESAHSANSGAGRPVYSNAPFLFSVPAQPDTSIMEVDMADLSQEHSLVLRADSLQAESSTSDNTAVASATGARQDRLPPRSIARDEDAEEDSDDTPVKHQGSDDGRTVNGDAQPRVFARGAVSRTRRRRGPDGRSIGIHGSLRRRQQLGRDDIESNSDEEPTVGLQAIDASSRAINYFMPPALNKEELSHLDWPEILLGYAQVAFNASLLAGFLYLIYCVASTIAQDVRDKVHESSFDAVSEIQMCSEKFKVNRCDTDGAVPALAAACKAWARCMARDPAIVGKARVAAETFAEILNGFVDVISWKSMIFCLAVLAIVVRAANTTFSFFRSQGRRRRELREARESEKRKAAARQGHYPMLASGMLPPYGYPHYTQPNLWNVQASSPATPAAKRRFFGRGSNGPTADDSDVNAESFSLQ